MLNHFFEFIVPITDFLWDFPTNLDWYRNIPVLGTLSFPVLLLLATGLYFSLRTRFVQMTHFTTGLRILTRQRQSQTGVSSLAAFLLGTAMRVGPGNIMGVTGAISVGGAGALFWMWVSAFLGMSTAFAEAVLAQIFKEKKEQEFVGGLPFYGMRLLKNRKWVALALSFVFVSYALLNVPPQTFHMFTALGSVLDSLSESPHARNSNAYLLLGVVISVSVAAATLGGLRRLTRVTDILVPVMAVLYVGTVLVLLILNFERIPLVFESIFVGAFRPDAMFGGALGVALTQGIKRGLMSNEAGQGTITPAAAVADTLHPCEQGFAQSLGVFLDTMIICSMTGFLVIMAQVWSGEAGVSWDVIRGSKLTVYMTSVTHLTPGTAFDVPVKVVLALCYAIFAFTTLVGMISFAEIAGNAISRSAKFSLALRIVGALVLVPIGALCVIEGYELGNIWYIADFANIMMVFANVPLILLGSGLVVKALRHYNKTKGESFRSESLGLDTEFWK
jgi:AGCS family alanine or glycine:cation symporter